MKYKLPLKEPEIRLKDIIIWDDENYNLGNVFIVTGASSGIGRATAMAAAANNLTVVGLDINLEGGLETEGMVSGLGGSMEFIKTDLTNAEDVKYAVTRASGLGNIKYLANIAGIQHVALIEEFPLEKFKQMIDIMVTAPWSLSQKVGKYMKASKRMEEGYHGVMAHMGSIHSHICTKGKSAYNTCKHAIPGISNSLASDYQGDIRSFTVSTGYVLTELVINQLEAQAKLRNIGIEEVVDKLLEKSLIKEFMMPIEVGNIFMHLFSRHCKHFFGDFLCDGGMVKNY